MKPFSLFLMIFIAFGITGCGSNPPEPGEPGATLANIPDWYANPPQDSNYLYSTATAMSRDMQMATDKAKQQARTGLVSEIEARIDGLIEGFSAEDSAKGGTDLAKRLNDTGESVVTEAIEGVRLKDQEIFVENDIYRTYVLMQLQVGAVDNSLLKQIKADQDLYNRVRSTKALSNLEKEVAKYKEFRKEQGMTK
jgi:hypothetical protein